MLNVQMMIGSAEVDRMKGSSHSRYHGYTTGAHKSDAAIGQANASEDHSADLLLIQIAVRKPTRTARPATTGGGAARSRVANTGSLKRKFCTYVPSEPIGIQPWSRNGAYMSPTMATARAPSRMRTRFQ